MRAAMDIRVSRSVSVVNSVKNDTRLLRRSAVIEIDQRLAIHLPRKDRKFRPQRGDIEFRRRRRSGGCDASRHA